jgi:hypothetical protein
MEKKLISNIIANQFPRRARAQTSRKKDDSVSVFMMMEGKYSFVDVKTMNKKFLFKIKIEKT